MKIKHLALILMVLSFIMGLVVGKESVLLKISMPATAIFFGIFCILNVLQDELKESGNQQG